MSQLSDDSVFANRQYKLQPTAFSSQNYVQNNDIIRTDIVNRYSGENTTLNVLAPKEEGPNLSVNPEFEEYLSHVNDQGNLIVASVIGSQKVGKSFLLDSLISADSGKTSRKMSQFHKPLVNSSTYYFKAKNNARVQFLDVNRTISKFNFFWLYMNSSVFILNLKEVDENEEARYLKMFDHVAEKLHVGQETDISLPLLIVVRRDCKNKEPLNQDKFFNKIKETGIFHPDIHHLHLPYPSKINTAQSKISNLPQMQINEDFKEGAKSINKLLRNSYPKIIKGNFYTSRLLLYTLNPSLDMIHEKQEVNVDQLWKNIIHNYGNQYRNSYMNEYKLRTNKQFEYDPRPRKQYDVYRNLSEIKRKTDKNHLSYQNLEGDPIFQQYKKKVENQVEEQEEKIIYKNHDKVVDYNSQNCKEIMSSINPKNYARLIDQYNEASDLEYQKSDVLLDNFKFFLHEKMKSENSGINEGGKSTHVIALESELKEMEEKIKSEKERMGTQNSKQKEIEELRLSIKEKEDKLNQVKKTMMVKKSTNPQVEQLENENNKLELEIEETEREAEKLLLQKQKRINDEKKRLESHLRNERDELEKLEDRLKSGVSVKNAGARGRDKTSCLIM